MGCILKIKNKCFLLLFVSIAILAVACRNPSVGGSGGDILSIPAAPDKSALSEKIGQAEDLLEKLKVSKDGADVSRDTYWVESIIKHKLDVAIETANAVLNDPNAQADEIEYALEELTKAYNDANAAKKPGKMGESGLRNKIDEALTLLMEGTSPSADGKDIPKNEKWVPEDIYNELQSAMEAAQALLDANVSQAASDAAEQRLADAIAAFVPREGLKTADLSLLLNLITNAENLLSELGKLEESDDGKSVYTDTYWISKAQKQALADAILEAKKATANPLVTQYEADEALNALNAAYDTAGNAKRLGTLVANKTALQAQIASAKTKIDGVKSSADGNDIPKYEKWVALDIYNKLRAAITTAETLMNDPHARQPAVNAAAQEIARAMTAFNPQAGKAPFNISQLSDLITKAQDLLAELQGLQESLDGTEVYEDVEWISAAQKDALANAISAAQSVADDPLVKPDVAEEALDALAEVYNNARNAKKYGTFTANRAELEAKIAAAYGKMSGIFTSNDGSDVLNSDFWVTHEMMAALDAAIISANTLNAAPYARQEAVDAEALKLDGAIAAFTPQKGLLVSALVKFTFAGPGDETITLTGAKTLSWVENTKLTVTVTETFTGYQWYVDGVIRAGETGRSVSLNARSFSVGAHTLTLKVMKGGVPYTKTLTFTVQ